MTQIVMVYNGLPRSITKCFISIVESYASWQERVWQPSGTFVFVSATGCPVRSCAISTRLLLSSDKRVWVLLVSTTGCPVPSEETVSSKKRSYIHLLGTGRLLSILHGSRVGSNNGLPRSIGSDNGLPRSITTWVWNWLVRLETSRLLRNLPFWSLSMFWTQFSFPIVFQGDLWWRPRWHVYFFENDFSSFQSNNFRNTIRWKRFMKNDSVRSNLIELQSFRSSKIDVDPIYCVLMSLPCIVQVLCMTRYTQVDRVRILIVFVHRINRQKYSVFCSDFDLQVSIPNWW